MTGIEMKRRCLGLTQEDVAAKLGVTQANVSHWEREKSVPSSRDMPKLASILNCKMEDLYKTYPDELKDIISERRRKRQCPEGQKVNTQT